MKKYKVALDYKYTMWSRMSAEIEANSLEEAQEKLLAYYEDRGDAPKNGVEHEDLMYTKEYLTEVENYAMIHADKILPHGILPTEDKKFYRVVEFVEEHNYELEKTEKIMKEQLITFETAELAKEKGFDISSRSDGVGMDVFKNGRLTHTIFYDKNHIYAPTQSLLQKWLREKHNIHICVKFFGQSHQYTLEVSEDYYSPTRYIGIETYEEALEKGLYESLLLIKH